MSTKIIGLKSFKKDINTYSRVENQEGAKTLEKIQRKHKEQIESAPWEIGEGGGGVPVDTGQLKESHEYTTNPNEAEISVDAPYAKYVHRGTQYMEARPWLDYSVQESRKERKFALKRYLDKLVNHLAGN